MSKMELTEIKSAVKIKNPALRTIYQNLERRYAADRAKVEELGNAAGDVVRDYNVYLADSLLSLGTGEHGDLDPKVYEYKTMGEFAAACGIQRTAAYRLMAWGRMLRNEAYCDACKKLSWSMFAEIAGMPPKMVNEAFQTGELSLSKTQKQLREWRDAHTLHSGKPEVVTLLNVLYLNAHGELIALDRDPMTEEDFYKVGESFKADGCEYIKLPSITLEVGGKKLKHRRFLIIRADGHSLYYGRPVVKSEIPVPTSSEALAVKLYAELAKAGMGEELARTIVGKQYPGVDIDEAITRVTAHAPKSGTDTDTPADTDTGTDTGTPADTDTGTDTGTPADTETGTGTAE